MADNSELMTGLPTATRDVSDEMGRALVNKYREIFPGGGFPSLAVAKALLAAAVSVSVPVTAEAGEVSEAVTHLAEKSAVEMRVPDWVADFLNRRTEVEHVLRLPINIQKNNAIHGTDNPLPPALTPDQMWELANRLSVPSEFGSRAILTGDTTHG